MSGVEMSTCEAMCVRTKFCVVSLYGCPCRMRLGGICEWCGDVNMSTDCHEIGILCSEGLLKSM